MTVYDGITEGLNQAILFNEGKLSAETKELSVAPVPVFTPGEIKSIRKELKMTLPFFAGVIGVSEKTAQLWESGEEPPGGSACRLIALLKEDPDLPYKTRIISQRANV